jgi:hypothetical protein
MLAWLEVAPCCHLVALIVWRVACLQDGEFIQVELVPWAGLLQHLQVGAAARSPASASAQTLGCPLLLARPAGCNYHCPLCCCFCGSTTVEVPTCLLACLSVFTVAISCDTDTSRGRCLQAEMAATGCAVDARLLSYACGLEHAKQATGGLEKPLQQTGPPAARMDGSSSCTLDSNASWGPLPFGSPIVSPLSSSALPAAATLSCSTQQQQRRWPAFAAGVAAGAAGCWLVLVGRAR